MRGAQTPSWVLPKNYAEVTDLKLSEGSFFTESNVPIAAQWLFSVLSWLKGSLVAKLNWLAQLYTSTTIPSRVVGIATAKGGNQFSSPEHGRLYPDYCHAAARSAAERPNAVDFLLIQAQDSQSIDLAMQEAKAILRASHASPASAG